MTDAPRPVIVQKYGGSSLASPAHIDRVAAAVVEKHQQGFGVVVVVSAMGDTTDALLAQAKAIAAEPDRRELDMLLSVGERISMALLALAVRKRGVESISLTGSQSGILTTDAHTNARIMEVRPFRIADELDRRRIVIVAGYQGVSYKREVTTLGRGGSDTTAIALAAALDAEACEIYSDVAGLWTADPRVVEDARPLDALPLDLAQVMADGGARVLHGDALEFARARQIALYARKTGAPDSGTLLRRDLPMPPPGVTAVAHRPAIWWHALSLDAPGPVFGALAERGLRPHPLIVQAEPPQLRFALAADDVPQPGELADALRALAPTARVRALTSISIVGPAVGRDPKLWTGALAALTEAPVAVFSSPLSLELIVPQAGCRDSVAALHRRLIETPGS